MLLSNDNTYYIGGKQVAEMYLNGNQVYLLDTGNNPFAMGWAKVKEICDAGEAANYFTLGDTVTIDCGSFGKKVFRVVGINQAVDTCDTAHGLILQSLTSFAAMKYHTAKITVDYSASIVNTWLKDTFVPSLPADLQAVLATPTLYHWTGTGNSSYYRNTITAQSFIASWWNMSTTDVYESISDTSAYRNLFGYFENNSPDFYTHVETYSSCWLRDTSAEYAIQPGLLSYSTNLGGMYGSRCASTDERGVIPCFCI